MTDIIYNIAAINMCTMSEGPHKRLAIWFQGCNFKCFGCCNPQFQSIEPKHIVTKDKLLDIIYKSKTDNNIEGITYLGGEPTLQKGLSQLSESVKRMGLGVILFTGETISNLNPEFLKGVDLVIDGQFKQDLSDERNLIGSSNQNIIFLTDRYKSDVEWFFKPRPKQIEVNIIDNGAIFSGDIF